MDEDLPAPDESELSPRMAAVLASVTRQALLIDRSAAGSLTVRWHTDAAMSGDVTVSGDGLDLSQE